MQSVKKTFVIFCCTIIFTILIKSQTIMASSGAYFYVKNSCNTNVIFTINDIKNNKKNIYVFKPF